jgi:hypothetical protein
VEQDLFPDDRHPLALTKNIPGKSERGEEGKRKGEVKKGIWDEISTIFVNKPVNK